MSYILDALRRADAERQQGQLPGLGSTIDTMQPVAAPPLRWPWWAAAAAVLLSAGVGLAWWWPANRTAVAAAPSAVVLVPRPVEPVAAPPLPAPLPIVVSGPPVAAVMPPVASGSLSASASATATAPAPAPASAPAARVLPIRELPDAQRRELPPLVVGGSVWSDSAPSRFVILDGQVLREGDALAPGLTLERINRKSAVLRWREMRVEVAF